MWRRRRHVERHHPGDDRRGLHGRGHHADLGTGSHHHLARFDRTHHDDRGSRRRGDGDDGGAADHDDRERRHLHDDREPPPAATARTTTTVATGEARTASATVGSGPDGSASGESAPPTTAGECDEYTTNAQYPLKLCDTGYDVLLVQQALAAQGFDVPTSGNFDPATDAAVRAYQEQFGLTVDGLVGRETWTHLVPDAPGQDNNGNGVVDPFEVTTG